MSAFENWLEFSRGSHLDNMSYGKEFLELEDFEKGATESIRKTKKKIGFRIVIYFLSLSLYIYLLMNEMFLLLSNFPHVLLPFP